MPVDTQHPDYQYMAPQWKKMRDVAAGQRAIHCAKPLPKGTGGGLADVPLALQLSPGTFTVCGSTGATGAFAGEAYLPRLHKETLENYCARRDRTSFFNATWRTIAGLAGMLFRISPKYKVSAVTEPMLDDITKDNTNLVTYSLLAALECLTVGRLGLFVDYPRDDGKEKTLAEVAQQNLRPQAAMYFAEQIINWATAWINNRTMLQMVVLVEMKTIPTADEFSPKREPRWRVLDLVPLAGADGTDLGVGYRVRVYKKVEYVEGGAKKTRDEIEEEFVPLMNGKPLPYIPFVFVGVDDTKVDVAEPPLIDLAEVNISHYQTTADLEHGAHKTALPQPWVTGVNTAVDENGAAIEAEFYIGGGDAWTFPSADTEVGMLEYAGQGLGSLENRLEAKQKQMAVLGARMLEDQKSGVEAAETAGIHRSGEQATLSSQGATLSDGIRQMLSWFDEWAGGDGEVEFKLNNEFLPKGMTPQMLAELIAAWQSGAISKETLFDNLKQGEVVRDAADFEEEESKIANQPPALLTGTPPSTSAAPGSGD